MNIITLDFETFYDRAFSLSKMTTEEYIRDELFEVIDTAVKAEVEAITKWLRSHGMRQIANSIEEGAYK